MLDVTIAVGVNQKEIDEAVAFSRDLHRFEDHGLEIVVQNDGTFSRSWSDERRLYKVNTTGCECKGFFHRGHCKHHAGYLTRLFGHVVTLGLL